MKLAEIRGEAEWDALRPEWDGLLNCAGSRTIFLTWEWLRSWWSAYGRPGELRMLTARDGDGALRAIAPLRIEREGHAAGTVRFVGDGSYDSDYLDVIAAAGSEKEFANAVFEYFADEIQRGLRLRLSEVPAESPNLPYWKSAAAAAGLLWHETETPCGVTPLSATWDEYLGNLKPRFRTKVRSVVRAFEARDDIRFAFAATTSDLDRVLPALYDLHQRRWTADGMPGVFGREEKRRFYAALSPALLDRGWLRLSWLEWQGRILACQYGFIYGNTYFHLQEGYEPASEHWNLGVGLRAWTIREFIRNGITEYDFLGGIGRHKIDWGASAKPSRHVTVAADTWKNRWEAGRPEWESRARERVAALLPEAVLRARRSLLKRSGAGRPAGSWLRSAAAKSYFHLRLPAVTAPLRGGYQLAAPGIPARFSPAKRTEPTGRILYYHRVNDEGDPFFPATPTRVFDEQIRHVAAHYKVVPLSELLDRLNNGSPEPIVAVTFDDGYRDNYTHALPILERYGVSATIFLTTGSLDTREPLWFERLAGAVQRTSREFLDVELDVPRRFYFRSVEERLRSNDGIFSILRRLTDAERRIELERIIAKLGAPDLADRRDRMLRWDEARSMTTRGITFGGHTVDHPFLSKLDASGLDWEVSECRRRIEEELQRPVRYFAYPNGREEDFNAGNKDALRAAGYEAALSTIWGVNRRSTDRWELRRGQPWENDPAVFAYKLDWYQWVND